MRFIILTFVICVIDFAMPAMIELNSSMFLFPDTWLKGAALVTAGLAGAARLISQPGFSK